MQATLKLSASGQLALPKNLRENDHLSKSDTFRLRRLDRGKYLLEKLADSKLPKARLTKTKEGRLVFRSPKGAPIITSELVKSLESETA